MNFTCTLCGSRDWPRSDTTCPLCYEPEEETNQEEIEDMNGKGDTQRPFDGPAFRANYDAIFRKVGVETCQSCEEEIGNADCAKCSEEYELKTSDQP